MSTYMQELHLEMSVYKSLCCTCRCAFVLNMEGAYLQEPVLCDEYVVYLSRILSMR